jgi:hypothetical protein
LHQVVDGSIECADAINKIYFLLDEHISQRQLPPHPESRLFH